MMIIITISITIIIIMIIMGIIGTITTIVGRRVPRKLRALL